MGPQMMDSSSRRSKDPFRRVSMEEAGLSFPEVFSTKSDSYGIQLYGYDEIPNFLKGNPYVVGGYRAYLPTALCLKSLCVLSNETVNIWSHLLGFVLFFILGVYDNLVTIPGVHGTYNDHLIYTVFLACFQFCMLCSAGYHLLCCHVSERVARRWLSLDLAGISVGVMGCYFPGVYYAYYCNMFWRDLYLLLVTVLVAVTLVMQLHPHFLSAAWSSRRLALFSALVAYGVCPAVHWIFISGGWNQPMVQVFFPKVVIMYFLGVLALVFYGTKVPERCLPGRVDYVGHSHQWWHLIVVAAFYWWHQSGLSLMQYRLQHPCHGLETRLQPDL
ncbi:progestin and adipoQ receptor family member 3-like isoform X1 [Branchiostoma floridae x Branchiostoma japonicum]